MVIDMNLLKLKTIGQLRQFLDSTQALEFASLADTKACCAHVARIVPWCCGTWSAPADTPAHSSHAWSAGSWTGKFCGADNAGGGMAQPCQPRAQQGRRLHVGRKHVPDECHNA